MNEMILLISGGDLSREESCLAEEGFSVRRFSDGAQAMAFAEKERVDIAVLDCELPEGSGLPVLQRLRGKFEFPIIMLIGAASESERIAPLMLGADDVVVKPFGSHELAAHVQALLRRSTRRGMPSGNASGAADNEPSEIVIGGLKINNLTHKCMVDGEEIKLTPLEFSILWYLCVHRGRVVPGEELFEAVWGEKYLDSAGTVMPHIARLRKKLHEPPRDPKYVKTVWGVGYTVDI